MARRFPLPNPPICPYCNRVATRDTVDLTNHKGNAQRPFYYCQSGHRRIFITWDDDRGILANNPPCLCRYPCRRNQTNKRQPSAWYACSSGECSFREDIEIGDNAVELDSTPSRAWCNSQPLGYSDSPALTTSSASDTSQLHEYISSMNTKIEQLERAVAAKLPNPDCPKHGGGRRSIFRRRHCIC